MEQIKEEHPLNGIGNDQGAQQELISNNQNPIDPETLYAGYYGLSQELKMARTEYVKSCCVKSRIYRNKSDD